MMNKLILLVSILITIGPSDAFTSQSSRHSSSPSWQSSPSHYTTTSSSSLSQNNPHQHHHPPTTTTTTTLSMGLWDDNDSPASGPDRLTSCLPYLLPILDGDHYGRYIYSRLPPLEFAHDILLGPFLAIYHSIPFLPLVFFLSLTFGVTRNVEAFSRVVRFNAQQAILIDIALIFPDVIGSVAAGGGVGGGSMPRFVVEPLMNFVYYTYVACVGYSVVSNLGGKRPDQIPIISEAADMQIGPF